MQVQYHGKKKLKKLNRVVSTLRKALSSRLDPTLKEASIGKVRVVVVSVVMLALESATDILTGYHPGIYLFTRRGWKLFLKTDVGIEEPWFPICLKFSQKNCLSNHPVSSSLKTVNSLQFFHENCRSILRCFWSNRNRRFSYSVLFPQKTGVDGSLVPKFAKNRNRRLFMNSSNRTNTGPSAWCLM